MAKGPQYRKGQGTDQLPQGAANELDATPNPVSADAGAAAVATGAAEAGSDAPTAALVPDQGAGGGDSGGSSDTTPQEPAPHPINDSVPLENPDAPVTYVPQSDDEKFLFAPGDGNVTGAQPGASMVNGPLPVPRGVVEMLPSLQLAANDPNASPQTQALFKLLTYHVNGAQ